MFSRRIRGFTLVEVMLVVIIIGILAAIAIPAFRKTIERTNGDRAVVNLKVIRAAQKMYRIDQNTYWGTGSLTNSDLDTGHYLQNPNIEWPITFAYTVTAADVTTFTARATRNSGPFNGGWIQINHNGVFVTGGGWPFTYP